MLLRGILHIDILGHVSQVVEEELQILVRCVVRCIIRLRLPLLEEVNGVRVIVQPQDRSHGGIGLAPIMLAVEMASRKGDEIIHPPLCNAEPSNQAMLVPCFSPALPMLHRPLVNSGVCSQLVSNKVQEKLQVLVGSIVSIIVICCFPLLK